MNRKSKVLTKKFKSEKYSNRFVVPRLQDGRGSADIWGCFNFNGVGVCNNIYGRFYTQRRYFQKNKFQLPSKLKLSLDNLMFKVS